MASGYQSKAANLTITLARRDLETIMSGASSFEALLTDGKAKFEGDCTAFDTLHGLIVEFTPTFVLRPGTSAPAAPAKPFAIPENDTHGIL